MKRYVMLALLGLSGCGLTAAEQRRATISNGVNSAHLAHNACIDAIRADPTLAAFSSRYPEYEASAPQSQIDSPARVTDELRPAFAEAHRRVVACRQNYRQAVGRSYPEAADVTAQEAAAIDRDWQAMVSGQITIGEGIRRANDRNRQSQAQMTYVNNVVDGQLQTQHMAELRQREVAVAVLSATAAGLAVAAQAQQEAAQRQQLINAINRPVITNCNRVGNSVNCMSY